MSKFKLGDIVICNYYEPSICKVVGFGENTYYEILYLLERIDGLPHGGQYRTLFHENFIQKFKKMNRPKYLYD